MLVRSLPCVRSDVLLKQRKSFSAAIAIRGRSGLALAPALALAPVLALFPVLALAPVLALVLGLALVLVLQCGHVRGGGSW